MTVSVGQVMRSINNFFESGYRATTYTITDGAISPSELLSPGMYIAITGSVFHDGVWKLGEGLTLLDFPEHDPKETFYGRVYFLHPPKEFLETCQSIAEFAKKTPVSGLQSESFGEYSMTRANGKNGGILTWQEAFADALTPYRRMYSEVF